MKKNTVALAVAAAMTASLLVGCGGTAADSTSTAESTATSTDAASAATTTADGDETLTVWAWDLLLFCCMMLSTLSCATWKLQTVQNTSLVKSIHRAIRWSAPV